MCLLHLIFISFSAKKLRKCIFLLNESELIKLDAHTTPSRMHGAQSSSVSPVTSPVQSSAYSTVKVSKHKMTQEGKESGPVSLLSLR